MGLDLYVKLVSKELALKLEPIFKTYIQLYKFIDENDSKFLHKLWWKCFDKWQTEFHRESNRRKNDVKTWKAKIFGKSADALCWINDNVSKIRWHETNSQKISNILWKLFKKEDFYIRKGWDEYKPIFDCFNISPNDFYFIPNWRYVSLQSEELKKKHPDYGYLLWDDITKVAESILKSDKIGVCYLSY